MTRYRLQPVLDHHHARERALQGECLALLTTYETQQRAYEEMHTEARALERELERSGPLQSRHAMLLFAGLETANRRTAQQAARRDQARRAWEEKQTELLEAMRERKKLERHRTRVESAHRMHVERAERATADDVATTRHVHAMMREDKP